MIQWSDSVTLECLLHSDPSKLGCWGSVKPNVKYDSVCKFGCKFGISM